ncbi:MAG: hypothetical protein AB7P76_02805 [Candidatus Melainabacteria bacterium]
MAKAINWPAQFREAVLNEPADSLHTAVRPGALYFDHGYWVDGEEVDIRVNHLKVRKAVIEGDLRKAAIAELTGDELQMLKPGLQTPEAVLDFLTATYPTHEGQPFTLATPVTVVRYRNRAIDPEHLEEADDPHM